MCIPVKDDAGELVGCVQAVNVIDADGSRVEEGSFTPEQEKLMSMLAMHIAIFVNKCS